MPEINLTTPNGQTMILIPGSFKDVWNFAEPNRTVFLIDQNVFDLYAGEFSGYKTIRVKVSEKDKDMEQMLNIYQQLMELEVDRSWTLIGVGGGITTDIAGFAASTYLRGLRFGFVSTTLLGQVDAAIGGKNGVNFKSYKNMVGNIRQPDFVICNADSLKTLPDEVFYEGFAEIIKYAFIRKPLLFDYLNDNISKALNHDPDVIEHLIFESAEAKKEIVEADEMESGERKLLNFGHTTAHALEKLYGISHGLAVAAGMMVAARLSLKFNMIDPDVVQKLDDLISAAHLERDIDFNIDELTDAMRKDKKRKGNDIQFILLEGIGNAVIKNIPVSDLKETLNDLR